MDKIDLGITEKDAMPTIKEVARLFGVPPHMINNEAHTTTSINTSIITIDELLGFLASARPPNFAKQAKQAIRRIRILKRKRKIRRTKHF